MNWLKQLWNKYNPFDIDQTIKRMADSLHEVSTSLVELKHSINVDIAILENELVMREHILQQIIDCLPDMVWYKDTDGRYIYANQAIKDGLLFNQTPTGMDDITLAAHAKKMFGELNHTFGEKCANSDKITLEQNGPSRFLESGRVQGEMLYLEVFKNVVRDCEGNVIGVCGSGRDMTEYVTAYKEGGCHKCPAAVDIFARYAFEDSEQDHNDVKV